jgi:hypothetical protein
MTDKKINLINPLVSNVDLFTHATALLAKYAASEISVDELHTLIETAHLLRTEKNAQPRAGCKAFTVQILLVVLLIIHTER